jgi:zinc D-Ala-D-Ala carboxypeptidase
MGAIVRPYFYKQSTSKRTNMENTMNKKTENKVIEQIKKEAIREQVKNEAVREQVKNESIDVDLKQQLSEHFKLSEFTQSGTARRHKVKNVPGPREVERLRFLCVKSLEPMRRRFGVIRITSGFRCKKLNALVGGSPTSQHVLGEAADIHTGGRELSEKMFGFAKQNIPFDQLILEHNPAHGIYWLHISLRSDRPGNRHEAFFLKVKKS